MSTREDVKRFNKIFEIIRCLDGWKVGEARGVLEDAKGFIGSTTRINVAGPEFTAAFEEFERNAAESDGLPR